MTKQIILASASPRRRELLAQVGLKFSIVPSEVDESIHEGENPEVYAIRVALAKARIASERAGDGLVVAADTIVVVDNSILGKPADRNDAERMLTLLSGRDHRVLTGVAVVDAGSGKIKTALSVTAVWFRRLTSSEIASYIATGEPMDKAGAYGIQEKGALLVKKIEGCYANVVGLPLSLLGEMLEEFGVNLFE